LASKVQNSDRVIREFNQVLMLPQKGPDLATISLASWCMWKPGALRSEIRHPCRCHSTKWGEVLHSLKCLWTTNLDPKQGRTSRRGADQGEVKRSTRLDSKFKESDNRKESKNEKPDTVW